ncbi:AzlC family ABC transporter permease [Rodentibacter pneumotropicus]|nr:AzlC family ABC transporter permease [Rodentibacter pneumotropicus]TGZ98240.1 branched-chain amino acid ABC transporter permease [Rodentibacter pneumotropicus]THA01704.1 branched-chain amino acid ABC transporter permease [Rodentibacter pneumotropicus]
MKLFSNKSFNAGLKDSISFGLAFIFLYVPIGALSASQGLGLSEVMATSIFIFSTPLQFMLIQSYGAGISLIPIILALNSRFILMSSALSGYFKNISYRRIFLSSVLIVPSVFSACISKFKNKEEDYFLYFLGVGLPIYFVSVLSTFIGYYTGSEISSPLFYEIVKIVLPLQFTALAAKHWPDYLDISAYWIGLLLAPVFLFLFKEYTMIIAPFLIGISFATLDYIGKQK